MKNATNTTCMSMLVVRLLGEDFWQIDEKCIARKMSGGLPIHPWRWVIKACQTWCSKKWRKDSRSIDLNEGRVKNGAASWPVSLKPGHCCRKVAGSWEMVMCESRSITCIWSGSR
jgi:hypothetical protein